MNKIILLKGENANGTARVELTATSTKVSLSFRRQAADAKHVFFISGSSVSEGVLSEQHTCAIDKRLDVEGILVGAVDSSGLRFIMEGKALGAKIDLVRVKEGLRLKRMKQPPRTIEQSTPSSSTERSEAILPETQGESIAYLDARFQESIQTDWEKDAEQFEALTQSVPKGAEIIEGKEPPEDDDLNMPAAQSEALKNILEKAQTLYPMQQSEQVISAKTCDEEDAPPPGSKGAIQSSEWEAEVDNMLAPEQTQPLRTEGLVKHENMFNPFPDAFPRSSWKRVNYPGTQRFYLVGEAVKDNGVLIIHALPGDYAPVPPMRQKGFTRFMRASDGSGYWLKIRKKS